LAVFVENNISDKQRFFCRSGNRKGKLIDQRKNNNESRLELVRAHVGRGFYDRCDIVEATASAFIKNQALHILLDRYELQHREKDPSKNPKLVEIRRKIDSGYYDNANHLADLVEKLIKKLDLE
jgi:hypothetical protein